MAEAQLSSIKCTNFSDVLENAVQEAHGGLLDLAQRLPALSDEDRCVQGPWRPGKPCCRRT